MGQLSSIEEVVKDKDATVVLLKAIPKTNEWEPLITQLRFHTDATLEQTISTLLEKEKNKEGPSSNKTSFFPSFRSQVRRYSSVLSTTRRDTAIDSCFKTNPSKKRCGKCKKQGHLTRECEESSSKTERNFAIVSTKPSYHLF